MSKVNKVKNKGNEENIANLIMIMKKILHYYKYNNNNIININNEEIIDEEKLLKDHEEKSKNVLKVPVIIGEKVIEIPIQSKIKLKEWTSQIRNIKSNVKLVESNVIEIKSKDNNCLSKKGELFIKGILKNNIEYTSIDEVGKTCINGSIKYTSKYIPFRSTILINFNSSQVDFNKQIYCEVKNMEVVGTNLYNREKSIDKIFIMDKAFKQFEQNIVLKLTLSLIQEQQVK